MSSNVWLSTVQTSTTLTFTCQRSRARRVCHGHGPSRIVVRTYPIDSEHDRKMNMKNQPNHSVFPRSNPPLPRDLSFLGPSPLSHNQTNNGSFPPPPPQLLRGPGSTGCPLPSLPDRPPPVTSHKRKRTVSPEPAATGGYGPISDGGSARGAGQITMAGPPPVKLIGRKNTAHDIWKFVRAVEINKDVQQEEWPDDYDKFLSNRPDSPFIDYQL